MYRNLSCCRLFIHFHLSRVSAFISLGRTKLFPSCCMSDKKKKSSEGKDCLSSRSIERYLVYFCIKWRKPSNHFQIKKHSHSLFFSYSNFSLLAELCLLSLQLEIHFPFADTPTQTRSVNQLVDRHPANYGIERNKMCDIK